MSYTFLPFPNDAALAKAVAAQWLQQLAGRKAKPDRHQYNVALSGGRIARNFFEEIVRQTGHVPSGLFQEVHFFWADERCVPPSDPESNYAVARELLFEPLQIPAAQIHRLRGEGPESLALREAVSDVCGAAPVAKGQPVLDMVFLGMGEDGHVASLFPGEPEAMVRDEAVYRAVTAVKPPPRRITLGYAAITVALEVWVMVSGAGKEKALRESLSPEGKTPLARVVQQRAETKIFSSVKPG
ncbi:MAG: pgl [Pedosphaera sp.]|nr:pgl [Pedosphaera sp.]